jgi:hypothetical protein
MHAQAQAMPLQSMHYLVAISVNQYSAGVAQARASMSLTKEFITMANLGLTK